ncbi:MAG: HD-GYP domain-containing protein, partial [Deferrisomatales bacterium]
DTILLKKSRLSAEEFETLKAHTVIGYEILKGSPSKYLQTGSVLALAHHARFDGAGYPGGLRGDEIPLMARIVAVADVYDALTSNRPYKEAWPVDEAVRYLQDQAGRQFDPACVDAFLAGLDTVVEVQARLGDPEDTRR